MENYTLDLEILDGEHPLGGDQVRRRTQNMAYQTNCQHTQLSFVPVVKTLHVGERQTTPRTKLINMHETHKAHATKWPSYQLPL